MVHIEALEPETVEMGTPDFFLLIELGKVTRIVFGVYFFLVLEMCITYLAMELQQQGVLGKGVGS